MYIYFLEWLTNQPIRDGLEFRFTNIDEPRRESRGKEEDGLFDYRFDYECVVVDEKK